MEIISVAHSATFSPSRTALRYWALQSCRLLKMGPCRVLPASFQILFDFMEASFSALSSSSHQNL